MDHGVKMKPIYENEKEMLELLGGKEHLIRASKGIKKGDEIVVLSGDLVGHEGMIKWVNVHK